MDEQCIHWPGKRHLFDAWWRVDKLSVALNLVCFKSPYSFVFSSAEVALSLITVCKPGSLYHLFTMVLSRALPNPKERVKCWSCLPQQSCWAWDSHLERQGGLSVLARLSWFPFSANAHRGRKPMLSQVVGSPLLTSHLCPDFCKHLGNEEVSGRSLSLSLWNKMKINKVKETKKERRQKDRECLQVGPFL